MGVIVSWMSLVAQRIVTARSCRRLLLAVVAGIGVATAAHLPAQSRPRATEPAASKAAASAPKIDLAARREDWRWLDKYPDENVHRRAEWADLRLVADRFQTPDARLVQVLAERGPLLDQAEFCGNTPCPPELLRKLDANSAKLLGLIDVFRLLEQDIGTIVARYAAERLHLRKLWAGAPPGSIGFIHYPDAPGATAK